jgi:hypothetical protein
MNVYNNGIDAHAFEAKIVEKRLRNINKQEREIFEKSDNDIALLFFNLLKPTGIKKKTIEKILLNAEFLNTYILELKEHFSRLRPWHVNKFINKNKLKSITENTWSYPSGHTMQSYYLAHILSKQYPNYSKELHDLAEKIGQSRIAAGLHFPSDHDYGKNLIKSMINHKRI